VKLRRKAVSIPSSFKLDLRAKHNVTEAVGFRKIKNKKNLSYEK